MSKTMKKIGTIFAAATLVGATLTGAIAADLKDLPAPFVKDGKADVTIVVGASAATADVLGSIDIASALQAASVTTETVTVAGAKSSTVEDGAKLETSGNALLLGEALSSYTGSKLDDSDLPSLLMDGTVTEEDSNDDFDYTQEIVLGSDVQVNFDSADTDMKDPLLYLDLDTAADVLWTYNLDFTGGSKLDLRTLGDSETITMLGKTFTFDPSTSLTGDITLYGSDKTEYMTLNEPKTFTVEGKTYTVEITGGNSDKDNVVVAVNGVSKTIQEGNSVTVNGLELFAKDVFVTNIPTLSAAATLFIGSEKIVLQSATSASTYNEVEISGETVNGFEAWVESSSAVGNDNVTGIHFRLKPSELSGDIAGFDEKNWLEAGQSVADPMFGTFEVLFNGGNYALDDADKAKFQILGGDNELTVEFANDDGDQVSFTPFKLTGSNVAREKTVDGVGYAGAVQNDIADGDVFVLQDSASTPINSVVYEVTGFTTENSEQVVRLKNLGTGKTEAFGAGDKIVGSYTVSAVNSTDLNLSATSATKLYLKGGYNYLDLGQNANASNATQEIRLVEADLDQVSAGSTIRIEVSKDSSDTELDVNVKTDLTGTSTLNEADDGNDFDYSLTKYGSYLVHEADESDYVTGYVPGSEDGEVHYEVFFAPTGATAVAGGSTVTTTKVNPIAVGTAVLDSSVSLASETKNLIVVGGPCANSVAAALLKSDAANCVAGFTPGKAVVQLFDTPKGKVAMLVAGYEAIETQAASRAVALMDSRLVGKSVTLTVTSTSDFDISASQ